MATQRFIDNFYKNHGDCCAGCDWWRWHNSMIGECTKNAPVNGNTRAAMLNLKSLSVDIGCGHILTKRDHVCGDFVDTEGK